MNTVILAHLQRFWWWVFGIFFALIKSLLSSKEEIVALTESEPSHEASDLIESGFSRICAILELDNQQGRRLTEVFVANQILFQRHRVEQDYLLVLSRMISLAIAEYRRHITPQHRNQLSLPDIVIVMLGRSLSIQAVHRQRLEPGAVPKRWEVQLRECGIIVEFEHMEALASLVAGSSDCYARRPIPRLAPFCAYLQEQEHRISS